MSTAAAQRAAHENFNIATDLPSTADVVKIAKAVDTFAAKTIFTTVESRSIKLKSGMLAKVNGDSPTLEQAAWLWYLATTMKPILTVESGYNQGLAAAIVTAAHMANGLNGGHVPIQDNAKGIENGIGGKIFEELKLVGFQVMEHESAHVLPQLYLQRLGAGMKLVYFDHAIHSDEQIMEFFYLNQLMNDGGVFVVNTGHAARRFLVDYIKQSHRNYVVKELDCGLTLVQKPDEAAMMGAIFSA
jgi:hypothetical protein